MNWKDLNETDVYLPLLIKKNYERPWDSRCPGQGFNRAPP